MSNLLVITLSVLSTLTVAFAIITEGKLKKSSKGKPILKVFKSELSKVAAFGWYTIAFSLILNMGNGYLTIVNNNKNAQQLSELRSNSDSIRSAVVDRTIKEMEEQRRAIEKERENTFSQMQNEVEEDLRKTIVDYNKKYILSFIDTPLFVTTKLEDSYIRKYESITLNKYLIYYLTQSAEAIRTVNYHIDRINNNMGYPNPKRTAEIKYFLESVELAKDYFYPIYARVYNINSYKEYESIKWADSIPQPINREVLNKYILMDYFDSPMYERSPKIK